MAEHTAEINGLRCEIRPAFVVEWEFAGKDILTMMTGDVIHCVSRVSQQPEAGIMTMRPNFCDHPQVYTVRCDRGGGILLTSFTRTRDSIRLVRN